MTWRVDSRIGRLVLSTAGAAAVVASAQVADAADDVARIREKCAELAKSIISEEFSHQAEGKDSALDRVYKDFDYLLKPSKTDVLLGGMESATGPDKDRLARCYDFLLGSRIFYPIASSYDNAEAYATSASMAVMGSDVELTIRTYEGMLANEEGRSNRRIWYLASRDLMENANVFKLNLLIDLDKQSMELTEKSYDKFLAELWGFDPQAVVPMAEQVLSSTEEEYSALLAEVVPEAIDGMKLADVRQYDIPRVLRAEHLDDTFKDGKEIEVADKWLKDLGVKLKSNKKLRIKIEDSEGKWPGGRAFPIQNGKETRVSVAPIGGLTDYWELLGALGAANFFYHIDNKLEFEDQRLGSPLVPMVFARLFQDVMATEAWQAKYLKGNEAAIQRNVRFHQLHDLRRAAGHHLIQVQLHEDRKILPSLYTDAMMEAMKWQHTASEETNYLMAEDLHESGLYVLAAVIAAHLRDKLVADFGADWWSKGEAGGWLKSQWEKGFSVTPETMAEAWGLGDVDTSALLD